MNVYFDTSAIVPVFVMDMFSSRIQAFFAAHAPDIFLSDFVSAEFASVVSARVRMKLLTNKIAQEAFANFDAWARRFAVDTPTLSADIREAEIMLRRLDMVLRAPDAIHLAIARRLSAELVTFDKRMADCARALGIAVVAL